MKVKILYSTELEDLPQEVGNLIEKSGMNLRRVTNGLDRVVADLNALDVGHVDAEHNVADKIANLINLTTQTLNVVSRIDDCLGILSGLQKLLEDARNPPQQTKEEKEARETLSDG